MKLYPIVFAGLLSPFLASAVGAQDSGGGEYRTVQECRRIASDSVRVSCYDTVVDGGVFTVAVREKIERQTFGKSQVRSADEPPRGEPEQVIVEIVEIKMLPSRRRQFRTADGQIWREVSSGHMAPERTPFPAELRQGAMGSYSLSSLRWPKYIKVTRIK